MMITSCSRQQQFRLRFKGVRGQGRVHRQAGQALVEALVAFTVLLVVWVAIAWLGRFQDIALQASHASRHAAFSEARGEPINLTGLRKKFFTAPNHRWADRRGWALFSAEGDEVQLDVLRGASLDSLAQAGRDANYANLVRKQWEVADSGIVDAQVTVSFTELPTPGFGRQDTFMAGLRDFDQSYPRLVRHTAILKGAGHASDDHAVQQRVAASALGWADAADRSYGLSRQILSSMKAVDAGWGRPLPTTDWLGAWAGKVPERHRLTSGRQP